MKKALITGITGRDGSCLTELLLEKDHKGHGIIRRAGTLNTGRIDHLYQDGVRLFLDHGGLTEASRPDGMYRKLMESSRTRALGWAPRISLDEGIARTIKEYRESYE